MVRRIYVEKKPGLRQEARGLLHELQTVVGVSALEDLRLLNRYDVEGLDEAAFRRAVGTVFSEPQVDDTAAALPAGDCIAFGVEPLPGQFDQRADSAAQCIQLMTQEERPTVRTARIYLLFGPLTAADVDAVKRYVLNPVECREASLDLPERLAAQANEALAWEAALPAAKMDETGALVPSVTTFTRTLTLMPGGESAQGTVTAEMNVGSRFYRQSLPMALCVADISAKTSVTGAENGRLTAGKTMAYAVEIANAGTAEKTVPVELILPADVTLSGDLPEGFTRSQRQIRGEVKAAAAAGDEPFTTTLVFPMTVNEDALDGDEDAMRLLTGALRVDGKRVALPRVQLCGAKISARLLPQTDSLKAGETMALRVVLVNSGLAGADVRVSCVLPEGLSLVKAEETEPETETEPEEATGSEAESALPPEADDGRGADAEPECSARRRSARQWPGPRDAGGGGGACAVRWQRSPPGAWVCAACGYGAHSGRSGQTVRYFYVLA